jgi:hypothetical protein
MMAEGASKPLSDTLLTNGAVARAPQPLGHAAEDFVQHVPQQCRSHTSQAVPSIDQHVEQKTSLHLRQV